MPEINNVSSNRRPSEKATNPDCADLGGPVITSTAGQTPRVSPPPPHTSPSPPPNSAEAAGAVKSVINPS